MNILPEVSVSIVENPTRMYTFNVPMFMVQKQCRDLTPSVYLTLLSDAIKQGLHLFPTPREHKTEDAIGKVVGFRTINNCLQIIVKSNSPDLDVIYSSYRTSFAKFRVKRNQVIPWEWEQLAAFYLEGINPIDNFNFIYPWKLNYK